MWLLNNCWRPYNKIRVYLIILALSLGLRPARLLITRLKKKIGMLTHNLNMFPDLQGSCDQNNNESFKKNWLLKYGFRFLLDWLVLVVGSFEYICVKVTKNMNLVTSLADSEATPSHSNQNLRLLFNSHFILSFTFCVGHKTLGGLKTSLN